MIDPRKERVIAMMRAGYGRHDIYRVEGRKFTDELFAQMRADGTLDAVYIAGRNEWSEKHGN